MKLDITFIPSIIRRGRKFKGFAYYVGEGSNYTMGYAGSGVFPLTHISNAKLWDPAQKKFVYANDNFVEDAPVDPAKLEADKKDYIDFHVNGTIDWCSKQKPGAPRDEILRFAKNCMRKRHPEFVPVIDEMLSSTDDTRDIAKIVFSTLDWAFGLRTQPCFMYGKNCPGGKELPKSKVMNIAWTALTQKGLTKFDDCKNAWLLWTSLHQFPGEKFLAELEG